MDVVKTNIEKIGGSVDLLSEAGQGTTLKIKIPLTLAIIPALIVTSGGERFAIPQVSLLELVRLEGEQARKGIEMLYGAPVYRLRGQLLPLVYLNRELKLRRRTARLAERRRRDAVVNIVVLQADGRQFGLVVDEINDTEEIVVKPLGKQLKGVDLLRRRHHHGRRPSGADSGRARPGPKRQRHRRSARSRRIAGKPAAERKDGRVTADAPALRCRPRQPDGHSACPWSRDWKSFPVEPSTLRGPGSRALPRPDPAAHPRRQTCSRP